MQPSLDFETQRFDRFIKQVADKDILRVTKNALKKTSFEVRDRLKNETAEQFQQPVSFTKNAWGVTTRGAGEVKQSVHAEAFAKPTAAGSP